MPFARCWLFNDDLVSKASSALLEGGGPSARSPLLPAALPAPQQRPERGRSSPSLSSGGRGWLGDLVFLQALQKSLELPLFSKEKSEIPPSFVHIGSGAKSNVRPLIDVLSISLIKSSGYALGGCPELYGSMKAADRTCTWSQLCAFGFLFHAGVTVKKKKNKPNTF